MKMTITIDERRMMTNLLYDGGIDGVKFLEGDDEGSIPSYPNLKILIGETIVYKYGVGFIVPIENIEIEYKRLKGKASFYDIPVKASLKSQQLV